MSLQVSARRRAEPATSTRGRRVFAKGGASSSAIGRRTEQKAPRPRSRLAQPLQRGEHVLLRLRAKPFDVADLPALGRLLKLVQR